ncbi:hypothetical protein DMUE_1033 [Dictyocoela muelleri]|nr:hypothetical protein DMUE_1033 [Dictyocoela muelleri]
MILILFFQIFAKRSKLNEKNIAINDIFSNIRQTMDLIILKRVNYQMIIKYTFKDEKKHSSKILRKYEDILSEYNFILVNEKKYTFGYVVDSSISAEFVDIIKLKLRDLDMYLKLIMENILKTKKELGSLNFLLNRVLFSIIIDNIKYTHLIVKALLKNTIITNDFIFFEQKNTKPMLEDINKYINPVMSIFKIILRINRKIKIGNYEKIKWLRDSIKGISKYLCNKIDKEIYYGLYPLDFLNIHSAYKKIIENINEIVIFHFKNPENSNYRTISNITSLDYIEMFTIQMCIIFQKNTICSIQSYNIPQKNGWQKKALTKIYQYLLTNIESFIKILQKIPDLLRIFLSTNDRDIFNSMKNAINEKELLDLFYYRLVNVLQLIKNLINNDLFWKYYIYTRKYNLIPLKNLYTHVGIILFSLKRCLSIYYTKLRDENSSHAYKINIYNILNLTDDLLKKINFEISRIDNYTLIMQRNSRVHLKVSYV